MKICRKDEALARTKIQAKDKNHERYKLIGAVNLGLFLRVTPQAPTAFEDGFRRFYEYQRK